MILCLDCGNTRIKIGLFEGNELKKSLSIKTDRTRSSDEYAISFSSLIKQEVTGAIISSVVPLLTDTIFYALKTAFNVNALVVSKKLKTKLPIKTDNPVEVGSELIAGAIGARLSTPLPFIVADLGTATKLYVIDKNGAFIGAIITAGMEVSLKALVQNTSQLLETPIEAPSRIIGKNTKDSIQSGIVYGQAYMVSEFARRIEKELGYELNRVLTGGFADRIKDEIVCYNYDPYLVLRGLNYIYQINSSGDFYAK
ncbi:MAG: type III pantothenate kinase [Bacilli bacterium]|nr:type III pantothenate kinase [Bacilli bacterium]